MFVNYELFQNKNSDFTNYKLINHNHYVHNTFHDVYFRKREILNEKDNFLFIIKHIFEQSYELIKKKATNVLKI